MRVISGGCRASLLAWVAGATLVCTLVIRGGVTAQQPPVFRGGVQSIEVDVRVTDSSGRTVRGLTKDDFTLVDDGVPQTITSATFVDLAVTSPVIRIAPGSPEPDIATNRGTGRMWVMLIGRNDLRARLVGRRFIEEALGPYDEAAIIHVGGNVSAAQGFTRSRQRLLAALDRIEEGERALPDGIQERSAFQILEEICVRLGRITGRRKAIVYLDPPSVFHGDVASRLGQRDALRAATRNNVAIHVISSEGLPVQVDASVGNAPNGLTSRLEYQAGLRVLAEDTGGDAVVNTNNFSDGYQRIVRDTNEYYLLAYTPTVEHRDGEFHRLTVQVNRRNATVRARPGYYAPAPDAAASADTSPAAPEEAASGLSPAALEALRLPLAVPGIPLDVFVAPFRGNAPRTGSVLVGAQIAGADLALAQGEILEVGYRGMDVEGKTIPGAFTRFELLLKPDSRMAAESSGLRFVEWMSMPVGRHQLRFVANQPAGKTGMVVADVEVPDFHEDPVSVSGILLASERTASYHTLKGDPVLRKVLNGEPTALRSFSRRDTVTAYVEVYTNPKTSLSELTGTVTRAGTVRSQPIGLRTVATANGRTALATRLPLNPLQPGDYVLAYEARAGKHTKKREVLFTVTND